MFGGNLQKISFTVSDTVVKIIGNKHKPLLYVDDFCIKKNSVDISEPIYIGYTSSLIKFGEIKPGDKLDVTAKVSIINEFSEKGTLFNLSSIAKLSINKNDNSKRILIPKDQELLSGKIMSEHSDEYAGEQDFNLLVNNYLHWAKYAKHSNAHILHDAFSINTRYTFVAKVKGKIRNNSEDPSLVTGDNVSLLIKKELTTGNKIRVSAFINHTNDLDALGRLHVGDEIRFDALIEEKHLSKRGSYKYQLKDLRNVTFSK